MSSASAASTVLESSGAQSFPSLLKRPAVLPAAQPLMSSAPAAPTVPESLGARPFLSPLERPATLPAPQLPMLDPFLLDGKAVPLILNDLD
jgi:hypothetical protein